MNEKVVDKVRHRTRPSEPFGQSGAYGKITRTHDEGPLRVTPAARGIPAQAYVDWGDFCTWERLNDLVMIAPEKPRNGR